MRERTAPGEMRQIGASFRIHGGRLTPAIFAGEDDMHARVTTFEGPAQQAEAGVKLIKERTIPSAKKMKGFKAGYWLLDRAGGKGLAITFFESEAALKASEGDAEQTRNEAKAAGFRVSGVDRYEVVAQA